MPSDGEEERRSLFLSEIESDRREALRVKEGAVVILNWEIEGSTINV